MFIFKNTTLLFAGLLTCIFLMSSLPNPSAEKPKQKATPLEVFKSMRDVLKTQSQQKTLNKGQEHVLRILDKKVNKWEKRNAERVAKGKAPNAGKSWIAAFLLCFFLGGLGIHRFYLGYTWQGVVQLLTLGGLGIWWLIDFIRIIIKDLKPKDGDYE
jgi:hypothetical protein